MIVEASLSLGKLLDKKIKAFFVILIFFAVLLWIMGVFIVVELKLTRSDAMYLLVGIGVLILGALLACPLLYALKKDSRNRKQINNWIEDAIILNAKCIRIGQCNMYMGKEDVKIKVSFEIEGVKVSKYSTVKVSELPSGYSRIFNPYVNRTVKIAYSSKFGEVMFLKEEREDVLL